MKKIIILLSFLFAPLVASAQNAEPNFEEEMKRAEAALEEAAQTFAELYSKQYSKGKGSKRAMLGILLDDPKKGGVHIVGITPKSGAAQAGLQAGDLIVEIAGIDLRTIKNPHGALSKHMKTVKPGDGVEVIYLRDDKETEVTVVTQARRAHAMHFLDKDFDFDFDWDHKGHGGPGVMSSTKSISSHSEQLLEVSGTLAEYFDVNAGVVVIDVPEDAAIKPGDVILQVEDQKVATVGDVADALSDIEDTVEVEVKRKGRNRTVEVEPGQFDSAVHKEVKVIRIQKESKD